MTIAADGLGAISDSQGRRATWADQRATQGLTRHTCLAVGVAASTGGRSMELPPARVPDDAVRQEWAEAFATPARFATFCQAHEVAAYRVAYRILRDAQEAEEVAFDAFSRAHTAYLSYRATGAPFQSAPVPYLYQTARNAAIDRYRKIKRRRAIAPMGELGAADAAQVPRDDANEWDEEQLAVVRACIAALGSPHREVYAHYYLEELDLEAVATAVGLPYDRVRAVLKSAREQIGRRLTPHLLARALSALASSDRALLEPYYTPGAQAPAPADAAFEAARWRLIARLVRWEILFLRQPPDEHSALVARAQGCDDQQIAAAVTAARPAHKQTPPCTPAEAVALTARAVAWLDRRLRAAPSR